MSVPCPLTTHSPTLSLNLPYPFFLSRCVLLSRVLPCYSNQPGQLSLPGKLIIFSASFLPSSFPSLPTQGSRHTHTRPSLTVACFRAVEPVAFFCPSCFCARCCCCCNLPLLLGPWVCWVLVRAHGESRGQGEWQ